MIIPLAANLPVNVGSYNGVVTINVRQFGAGNLRLGTDRESLLQNIGANAAPGAILDGIPQAAADGVKQYFWSGDLWLISDVAGPVMLLAPAQNFFLDRSVGVRKPADVVQPSEIEGNLSTYEQ